MGRPGGRRIVVRAHQLGDGLGRLLGSGLGLIGLDHAIGVGVGITGQEAHGGLALPQGLRLLRRQLGRPGRSQRARLGARAGRDQLADDHVLLQADQVVLGAVDGGLGQHPGRLLEGGGGQEGARVQRRLGHAEQHGLGRGGLAALGQDPVVDLLELEAVDQLGRQQVGVTGRVDRDLAQHLPHDDLDVLVGDGDAL
jgi:hypothetical protein